MFNSLERHLYCIYDKKLHDYSHVFLATGVEAKKIFTELANDVSSPVYHSVSDYDVIDLGEFSPNDMIKTVLCGLDSMRDLRRIELQWMIQTLNFLPSGYFKMPEEMQKDIKDKIDEALKKYISYQCEHIEPISSV